MAQSKADSEVASVAPPTRRSFLFMLGLALDGRRCCAGGHAQCSAIS